MRLIDTTGPRPSRLLLTVAVAAVVAACSSTPNRAPVEDRTPVPRATVAAATPAAAPSVASNAEPARQPEGTARAGFYTVKPGDTLIRIGLDHGQNWRDIVRWNGLDNPNVIEVGQVLRVVPPGVDPATLAGSRPLGTPRTETRPPEARPPGAAPVPLGTPATVAAAAVPATTPGAQAVPPATAPATAAAPSPTPSPTGTTAAAPREGDDDVAWGWPVSAPVAAGFDEQRNKGLVFRGKAGDPVYAAADGRVVYAGSGLRGYGNLVILKHNNTYLTAYAHNQALLVKDEQVVKKGQKIAEMGSTDADAVQLHFEVRRQGRPVDPARLLPSR